MYAWYVVKNNKIYYIYLALFPGPAQLSVTFLYCIQVTESWVRPENEANIYLVWLVCFSLLFSYAKNCSYRHYSNKIVDPI